MEKYRNICKVRYDCCFLLQMQCTMDCCTVQAFFVCRSTESDLEVAGVILMTLKARLKNLSCTQKNAKGGRPFGFAVIVGADCIGII